MGLSRTVAGVDGGNSKTELALASLGGQAVAYVRGPGSNSHAIGAAGVAHIVARLLEAAGEGAGVEAAVLFCCGADLPADIEELRLAFEEQLVARQLVVDNDAFALLHAGRRRPEAVAVVCGAGVNAVGSGPGQVARYPSLGWESGDWGGSEMLGREALYLAARARDGRGRTSVLPDLIEGYFHASLDELAAAVHYRRMPVGRLGELAPFIVAAADHDAVAASLLDRLARELALMAWRATRDLGALDRPLDVVLGGGMMVPGGPLERRVKALMAQMVPNGEVLSGVGAPVVGAVVAGLDLVGEPAAARRFRAEFPKLGPPADVPAAVFERQK